MNLISEIRSSWGWIGIEPEEIVGENDFGNLMIRDVEGKYWRLCPEDVYCKVVAGNRKELDALATNQEFLADWHMEALVARGGSANPDIELSEISASMGDGNRLPRSRSNEKTPP